jgi:hypothetical protein
MLQACRGARNFTTHTCTARGRQVHRMVSLTLLEGTVYHVTVAATNRAGPRLSYAASSAEVVVDTSPPLAAAVFNT